MVRSDAVHMRGTCESHIAHPSDPEVLGMYVFDG